MRNIPVNSSSLMWNKKQKNYPRFNEDNCTFEKKILACARDWGVDFQDKEILDIGCGTGKYTILLGYEAKKVYGLDFSPKMLEILKKDVSKFGLEEKIEIICQDFKDFEIEKSYDIVFASMTPALLSEKAYKKMYKASKTRVYLGWGGKRESKITDEIFSLHGLLLHAPSGSEKLTKWLNEKQINYKNRFFETTWHHEKSLQDTIEDEAWHIQMHGANPDKKLIGKTLQKYADKEGFIKNKTYVRLELIVW